MNPADEDPQPGGPALKIWTVYERPRDYPQDYVARLWLSGPAGPRATASAFRSATLKQLRQHLKTLGLTRLNRHAGDDPAILETWF
jgi:hypothetical protein